MITKYKTLPFASLASCALLCAFTSLPALAADTATAATQAATLSRPAQVVQLTGTTAVSPSPQKSALSKSSGLTATATRRLNFFRRPNENLARHVTAFRGPIGPTLPAGATLHRNPAGVSGLLEVTAAPDDFIFELPPGAFLRKNVATQTQ